MDPKDEIIPLSSSLCVDVMYEYIKYKYENDKNYGKEIRISDNVGIFGSLYKSLRKAFWKWKFFRSFFIVAYEKTKTKNFINKYSFSYINSDDFDKFIESCDRITKIVIEVSKLKATNLINASTNSIFKTHHKITRSKSTENIHESNHNNIIPNLHDNGTHSLDSSFNIS